MARRKWLPTVAELVDRLTIHTLKEWHLPEHRDEYRKEMDMIKHDLNLLLANKTVNADVLHAVALVAIANCAIWENEAAFRRGDSKDPTILTRTHSINGIRNRAGNVINRLLGETRFDHKTDCLAADDADALSLLDGE